MFLYRNELSPLALSIPYQVYCCLSVRPSPAYEPSSGPMVQHHYILLPPYLVVGTIFNHSSYCKSTIFGRYKIWWFDQGGPIWRTLIWRPEVSMKRVFLSESIDPLDTVRLMTEMESLVYVDTV